MSDEDVGASARRLALKLLGLREHSRRELARKLADRGIVPEIAAETIDRLVAEGSLDESRLAELYVAERVRKGYGPLRIRSELRDKGLSESDIVPYLSADAVDWTARMAQTYERKYGPDADEAPPGRDELIRRARFLEQRGFPTDTIRRFLRWND
jgi:regulatory protein